jgi:hypothetical protein
VTRRRIVAVALVLAVLFAGGATWAWYRHEDPAERAVHEELLREGQEVDRVSCDADHTWRLGEKLVTFYRCIPQGGAEDGVLRCVALVDGRFLTPDEARKIPTRAGLCTEQG